jgi:hypothetical protein
MSKTNPQFLIESGGANNMGATLNSDPFYLGGRRLYSIQANTNAGTHVGTLKHQGSNDGQSWEDIILSSGLATIPVASGADPSWLHNGEASYMWIRVVYTRTSGDGQLDVIVSTKRN